MTAGYPEDIQCSQKRVDILTTELEKIVDQRFQDEVWDHGCAAIVVVLTVLPCWRPSIAVPGGQISEPWSGFLDVT